MLILQTDDFEDAHARVRALGVRTVWEKTLPDIRAMHLHPKDIGGAIVSIDQPMPPASWRWGGPAWRMQEGARGRQRVAGVTMAAADPPAMAARWAEVLDVLRRYRTPAARASGSMAASSTSSARARPAKASPASCCGWPTKRTSPGARQAPRRPPSPIRSRHSGRASHWSRCRSRALGVLAADAAPTSPVVAWASLASDAGLVQNSAVRTLRASASTRRHPRRGCRRVLATDVCRRSRND